MTNDPHKHDKFSKAIDRLEDIPAVSDIDPEVETEFRGDLIRAITLREHVTDARWAPYTDPMFVSGAVRTDVTFPNATRDLSYTTLEIYLGPSFGMLVRPLDAQGRTTSRLYGVPLLVHQTVPLKETDIMSRPIGRIRLSKDLIGKSHEQLQEDDLMKLLLGLHGAEPTIKAQDVVVALTYGELLRAYEQEGCSPFAETLVTQVTAVIPVNPLMYKTEAVGLAVQNPGRNPENIMCFGYGVAEAVYRGRPIVAKHSEPRMLQDIGSNGELSYFTVESLGNVKKRDQDAARDVFVGNMVVMALPLVGEKPYVPSSPKSDSGEPMFMKGTCSSYETKGHGHVDLAALSTGSATGIQSNLVPGTFDKTRPPGILDIRLITISPEEMNAQ